LTGFRKRTNNPNSKKAAGAINRFSETKKYKGECNDNCKRSYEAHSDSLGKTVARLLAGHH
jgi:hypothetical protein